MPAARAAGEGEPIRLVEFTRSFHLGGTEGQVLELLRGLAGRYRIQVAVVEAAGPLLSQVEGLGLRPEAFPLRGSIAQANTAVQILRLAAWLRAQRAELLHVHDFYATALAVPAAKLARCKVIVGRLDLAHWLSGGQRKMLSTFTRWADHAIANAEAIRRMLVEEERVPAARVSVIHNGLDVARFDARMKQGLSAPLPERGGLPAVVHVANMNHPVKRQEDLLAALAEVNGAGARLHAFLVGDGPRRRELEALAGSLGVSGTVHFLGHRTDVPAIYAAAQLGVLCSNAEGLSNAIIEGMAAALPMVVTRVGGSPDLVADGERGRVVAPERPPELAAALRWMLDHPQEGAEMGRRGREFVERELSIERLLERHDRIYRQVARRV